MLRLDFNKWSKHRAILCQYWTVLMYTEKCTRFSKILQSLCLEMFPWGAGAGPTAQYPNTTLGIAGNAEQGGDGTQCPAAGCSSLQTEMPELCRLQDIVPVRVNPKSLDWKRSKQYGATRTATNIYLMAQKGTSRQSFKHLQTLSFCSATPSLDLSGSWLSCGLLCWGSWACNQPSSSDAGEWSTWLRDATWLKHGRACCNTLSSALAVGDSPLRHHFDHCCRSWNHSEAKTVLLKN